MAASSGGGGPSRARFFLTGGLISLLFISFIHHAQRCANDAVPSAARAIGRVAIGSRRTLVSGVKFSFALDQSPRPHFHSRGFGVSSVRSSTTPVSGLNVAARSPRDCNRAFPRAERRATRRAVMLPGAGARPHRSRTSQSSRVQKACQKAPDDESESPRTRICAPAPGSRVATPRRTRRLTQ